MTASETVCYRLRFGRMPHGRRFFLVMPPGTVLLGLIACAAFGFVLGAAFVAAAAGIFLAYSAAAAVSAFGKN